MASGDPWRMIKIIATGAGQSSLTAEKSAKPEEEIKENATDTVEVGGGQMAKIWVTIEQLLRDAAPLSILTPRQAWRRITDQLKNTGVNVRELPHASTYKRFRDKYRQQYGLR
jgi:hypothetical protein